MMKTGRVVVAVVLLGVGAVLFLQPVNEAFGRAVDTVIAAVSTR